MAQSVKQIRLDHLGSPKPPLEIPWDPCKRVEEFEWESTFKINIQGSLAVIEFIHVTEHMLYDTEVRHCCAHIGLVSAYCLQHS